MSMFKNLIGIFSESPQNAGRVQPRVFQERSGAFNDRQRRGAMRRKIHEVTGHKYVLVFGEFLQTVIIGLWPSS